MRGRRFGGWGLAALGMALALPAGAEGQVQVRVQVDWQWGDDAPRYRGTHAPATYRDVRYRDVRYQPLRGYRIPRGFRPARGYCRLWYPGRPPGHQPHPVACHRLQGRYVPGVLVVTWKGVLAPYPLAYRTGYRYDDRDRWYESGYWYQGRWYSRDSRYDTGWDRDVRYQRGWDDDRDDRWDDDRWEDRGDWWDDRDEDDDREGWRDDRRGNGNRAVPTPRPGNRRPSGRGG